ncbi:S8 family serine peptidase [Luedemannella helvata]|uniref:S8 family serine peptidase n=1 Tax=Luedemannella helvata TaxID=349315 RepID=A0ABN2L2I9_9ACTN
MQRRRWSRPSTAAALALALLLTSGVAAQPRQASAGAPAPDPGGLTAPDPGGLTALALGPPQRTGGVAKALTSRLARTDERLLGRRDTMPVPVMVKLDYDPVATYTGNVPGFAATSPSVTGRTLREAPAERRYTTYVEGRERDFIDQLRERVPGAVVGQRLRTVYGGVALTVPANRVADVVAIKGVVAVQSDAPVRPLTDASPQFIGATDIYPRMGGPATAGRGVIVGVLDTGAWPEHPSFADQGQLGVPPPRADGKARKCDFGDNPLTPGNEPFRCNRKIVAGQAFLESYLGDPDRARAERFHNARDSDGHGTHTGSTAVGNVVSPARALGIDRGPVGGVAPGAWLSVYKVCGVQGCFPSDSAAAIAAAVKDGVKVINYSISGGTTMDVVELAFLDAYAAGVFVAAAAGNEGPATGTTQHLSPWVTTVAASTQRREFSSTLRLSAPDGAKATLAGATITRGLSAHPIVLASAPPYSSEQCDKPAPRGTFTGKIVACERGGNPRVTKGYNVKAGGAEGMVLYNPTLADVETDNHWLPAVHLAEGTQLKAFLAAHPGAKAEFTDGRRRPGRADVLAAFSSRGPAGDFLKPDISAPGVQIFAGHSPVANKVEEGPQGQYFQAIAGTSMASPHIAGAAALLRSLHPRWTPGQVRSAMVTTAVTRILKEDLTTPAGPFEVGSGRIDVARAAEPGLTFDETAARMTAARDDAVARVQLNLPTLNAPVMPGRLDITRTVANVSGRGLTYTAVGTGPKGTAITVNPARFTLAPGARQRLAVTIRSTGVSGQVFGQVRLVPAAGSGVPALHLPVAFVPKQGDVKLTSTCDPAQLTVGAQAACTVTAVNRGYTPTSVTLTTRTHPNLDVTRASLGIIDDNLVRLQQRTIPGITPSRPSLSPGGTGNSYTPLSRLGIEPNKVGDDELLNFDTPPFTYGGQRFTRLGVDTNGYVVPGGGTAEDDNCCVVRMPDRARPNNTIAPFWTDLDGRKAPGISVAVVSKGTKKWVVVEWRMNLYGTDSDERHFQLWLGVAGPPSPAALRESRQDVTFAYDPAKLPAKPRDLPFVVGAENVNGSAAAILGREVLPTRDLKVFATAPIVGAPLRYTVWVRGTREGTGRVTTTMSTPAVPGVTEVVTPLPVRRPGQ